jgi:hypothetical protein
VDLSSPTRDLPLFVAVPDTAEGGIVTFQLRLALVGSPDVADSCVVQIEGSTIRFVSATTADDGVTLEWSQSTATPTTYEIDRRSGSQPWAGIATANSSPDGSIVYEDRTASPGARYDYRLALVGQGGGVQYFGETSVLVPGVDLELGRPSPNPSVGILSLSFALPTAAPATLELIDIQGRRILVREVGAMGAGHHQLSVGSSGGLRAGVYFARLTQGGQARTTKVAFLP